jgi:hypothetical protein
MKVVKHFIKGQGIDHYGNELPVFNDDVSRHRGTHSDLKLPTEWTCTSYQNDELPSYQYNGWIIFIDSKKPSDRLGEIHDWNPRFTVCNWDVYNGGTYDGCDEPHLLTDDLFKVLEWVSKRCPNNRYTMEGMEIGYA